MTDIAIVGGGPVGLSLALALQDSGRAVTVLEARSKAPVTDARAIVLSHGSRLILERLGVWAALAAQATAITTIHVSQRGHLGRTLLNAEDLHPPRSFQSLPPEGAQSPPWGSPAALDVPAMGYTVAYADLHAALARQAEWIGVDVRYGTPVSAVEAGCMTYRQGDATETLMAGLVVLAEGGRGLPLPEVAEKDYGQSAVVCWVESERPHAGRAYERFTPEGPIALLPMGSRYALVWTTPEAQVEERLALSDGDFLTALYAAFGERQGRFKAVGARAAFPLRMSLRGPGDTAGLIRIGNAAQLLHPVAGQGFNLGLRDAWQLAECILDSAPGCLGDIDLIQRYVRARGVDVSAGAHITDFLVDVFAHDPPVIAGLRGAALTALDLLPALKNGFARKMMHGVRTW